MKDIIFNEDFNEEEIIERFRVWVKEEHAKRATKKNRLFYVTTHDDFIEFGKTQLMAGFAPPLWMGHNQWEDLHQKYVDTLKSHPPLKNAGRFLKWGIPLKYRPMHLCTIFTRNTLAQDIIDFLKGCLSSYHIPCM